MLHSFVKNWGKLVSNSESVSSKIATTVLEGVSNGLWSHRAKLMPDIVELHGPSSSLKWFLSNMPAYEKILKNWGPIRTHFIAVVISAFNGCSYCTYGHGYAFQLHWFNDFDELFPMDEVEMVALGTRESKEVREQLEAAITTNGRLEAAHLLPWLERVSEIIDEPESATNSENDKALQQLISMFGFLNACAIEASTKLDEAHDPINKDTELRARYDDARAQETQ